jgi:hypothetical protein
MMESAAFGIMAFGFVAVVVGLIGLLDFESHADNMDDEGGWK